MGCEQRHLTRKAFVSGSPLTGQRVLHESSAGIPSALRYLPPCRTAPRIDTSLGASGRTTSTIATGAANSSCSPPTLLDAEPASVRQGAGRPPIVPGKSA